MKITIKDIAKATNVSYSTVSKALNDSPLVKPDTKQFILEKADELGYTPNYSAKHLVTKRTNTIGLVWPEINRLALSELASQVNVQMKKQHKQMLLSINDALDSIDLFSKMRVDGMLLFEEDLPQDQLPKTLDVPLLSYGVPSVNQFPTIGVKHELAMELAVQELVRCQNQSIAYVGVIGGSGRRQQAKEEGFARAMEKNSMEPLFIQTNGLDVGDALREVKKYLKEQPIPDAMICSSYDIAIGTYRALHQSGLKVPDDVSLISYDNIPQFEETDVPISAVGVPVERLAKTLVDELVQLIENPEQKQSGCELVPELVVRRSSEKVR
ncbi:LacI family DNA-binding transcriptional regulator [Alkalihalobacillus sp. FSL W8-0930]